MGSRFFALSLLIVLLGTASPPWVRLTVLAPPREVRHALLKADVTVVADVAKLPRALQSGHFSAGRPVYDWKLANPGASWQATDVIVTPHLPRRRLIFAACDARFCILHYELGGIGHSMHLVAFERDRGAYKLVWHAIGFGYISSFTELRSDLVRGLRTPFYNAEQIDGL